MAYTIKAFPATYSSFQDDLIYTVAFPEHTSDPVTYPDYKFIGDVYVGGVLVARIKKVQDPTTGIGIFNIGQVVRNYVNMVFDPTANLLVAQQFTDGQFRLSVQLKFGEEYGFVSYLDLLEDTTRVFFNNYNGRLIGLTSSLTPFADRAATNRPLQNQTFLGSPYNFLPYFPTTTAPVNITITPFGDGTVYATTFAPANAFDLQLLNLSPVAINAAHAGTITPATTYYTVLIGGVTYRFDIICEPMYQPYMLHFLNQYGGFESKIFAKVSRKTYTVTRKDFGKLRYTVDGDGQVNYKSPNGVYNESRSAYANTYIEKLLLNTDNLLDQEYSWLSELIFSPMVYIEDGGYIFPCVITDDDYEIKKIVNDDPTNLTLDIEFGQTLNSQFR